MKRLRNFGSSSMCMGWRPGKYGSRSTGASTSIGCMRLSRGKNCSRSSSFRQRKRYVWNCTFITRNTFLAAATLTCMSFRVPGFPPLRNISTYCMAYRVFKVLFGHRHARVLVRRVLTWTVARSLSLPSDLAVRPLLTCITAMS